MNTNSNKELVQKGEILTVQGEHPQCLHYIHSGIIEILSASIEYEGLDPDIIISKSKRIGIINEETLVSGFSVLLSGPNKKSLRVLEDSYITKYPIKEGGIKQIVRDNPNLATTILTHLFKRLELSISDSSKHTKLYQYLSRINDNISIMHKALSARNIYEKLQSKSDNLYNMFTSNGGDLQIVFNAKFLITDNSQFLKKKYSFPGLPMESLIDQKQCQLIKKILKINPKIFGAMIKTDPSILVDMFELLTDNLFKVLDRIESIRNEIDNKLQTIFGHESSWSSFFVEDGGFDEYLNNERFAPDFIKNFLSLIKKIHSLYSEISGNNLIETYDGCKKIHGYYVAMASRKEKGEEVATMTIKADSAKGAYQNSIQQIFEFALIDKEMQKNILKVLNDFKNMNNPFNTETEGRKVRKQITRLYWDIYKQVYLRSQKESILPPPVNLMLNFGYFDDELLEEDQIQELHELVPKKNVETDLPIVYETEFLKKIQLGEENPSITEMGLTYEAFLREEARHKRKKKKDDLEMDAIDENIKKVMYEIDHRLATTVAVCSGSTATAFPILTSMIMKGSLSNNFISPEKLISTVNALKDVDYSVFYRETVLKLENAREIIQDEVIPDFILLPAYGTKTMMWQELDGTNRKTRGRIIIPSFFIGDLLKNLAHSLACFRWELNRTIKGGMWADPVDGGITGIYFDYVNFYKKNRKLSAETKAKITERFKGLRTNRDRFADDYMLWVLFEKDGIMRVNSVIREMFYRFIPFKEELRDKLENMPAFNDIANRYKNIQNKSITGYERKYKKYMDASGNLPEELKKYMEFINS